MGCAQSTPVQVHSGADSGGEPEPAVPDAPKAAGSSTRARRLSYEANGVQVHAAAGAAAAAAAEAAAKEVGAAAAAEADTTPAGRAAAREGSAGAAAAGGGLTAPQLVKRNSSTRARRLSYVTQAEYGEQLAAVMAAAEAEAADEEGGGGRRGGGPPAPAARAVEVTAASMSRVGVEPGYKKTNQDACFVYSSYISEHCSLFGAFDGHGPNGHLVSAFVKQNLPVLLADCLAAGAHPGAALAHGFLAVDQRLGSSPIDCEFSGSTAVVAFLKGNELTTAWVGDSRAVLGRATPCGTSVAAVELTEDHKPAAPRERERILRSQGRVERLVDEEGQPMGPYRVWLSYAWVPGLAMSRALGDRLAHTVGVTSEPDHVSVTLVPEDRFLLLASDGVWEFISSQEAVDLVVAAGSVEDGCRALVDEAHQRWLVEEDGVVDDITAVVVALKHNAAGDAAAAVVASAARHAAPALP